MHNQLWEYIHEKCPFQEQERSKSPLGVAPSIQDIARGLIRKALQQIGE
ncbi:hypothetical protein [Serratia marcescens]|nr:hypothetical protein [Serratia marcescens]